jgi:uncharacterized protein (DUF488 family)
MKLYTIGYGGRKPEELVKLLKEKGIHAIVDVRLRPDKASLGTYVKSKDSNKGIQSLLENAGIRYFSFIELGNPFMEFEDWAKRYRCLMDKAGELLVERLSQVPLPFCLMCAEKCAADCHRSIIAEYLVTKGYQVEHIE